MSAYDREYFFSFDDYEKMSKSQPIALKSYNENKFDFYEMRFNNGVSVYFFNSLNEAKAFKSYFNFPNVPYTGEIKEMNNRVIVESIKRNVNDFIDLSNQLAEGRTHCFISVPFKLSWQENPKEDFASLMGKYGSK